MSTAKNTTDVWIAIGYLGSVGLIIIGVFSIYLMISAGKDLELSIMKGLGVINIGIIGILGMDIAKKKSKIIECEEKIKKYEGSNNLKKMSIDKNTTEIWGYFMLVMSVGLIIAGVFLIYQMISAGEDLALSIIEGFVFINAGLIVILLIDIEKYGKKIREYEEKIKKYENKISK